MQIRWNALTGRIEFCIEVHRFIREFAIARHRLHVTIVTVCKNRNGYLNNAKIYVWSVVLYTCTVAHFPETSGVRIDIFNQVQSIVVDKQRSTWHVLAVVHYKCVHEVIVATQKRWIRQTAIDAIFNWFRIHYGTMHEFRLLLGKMKLFRRTLNSLRPAEHSSLVFITLAQEMEKSCLLCPWDNANKNERHK